LEAAGAVRVGVMEAGAAAEEPARRTVPVTRPERASARVVDALSRLASRTIDGETFPGR